MRGRIGWPAVSSLGSMTFSATSVPSTRRKSCAHHHDSGPHPNMFAMALLGRAFSFKVSVYVVHILLIYNIIVDKVHIRTAEILRNSKTDRDASSHICFYNEDDGLLATALYSEVELGAILVVFKH